MPNPRIIALAASSMLASAACAGTAAAKSPHFQDLYTFSGGNDGGSPAGNLIADTNGNLYGTTAEGGPNGAGTVFKLAPDGTETVLYHFTGGLDGDLPMSSLLMDGKGNLYGVTEIGGQYGQGVVYKLTPAGVQTTIYSFGANSSDGDTPLCQLIWGPGHVLLGTTINGGTGHDGTVFEVSLDGKETILHDFTGTDGMYPRTGLLKDKDGNYYGTAANTSAGDSGTAFKIDPTGAFSLIYTFGILSGYAPAAPLAQDADGNLYGTTTGGGAHSYGTVFRLSTKGKLKKLYDFTGGADGADPEGKLFLDKNGNLLGTTNGGGVGDYGVVFSLAPTGKLTTLYTLTNASGSYPQAGLVKDKQAGAGWLYGSTYAGGSGSGTIFRLKN